MNEKFKNDNKEVGHTKTIEELANFEGSLTNVFFERIQDPSIYKQLIDMLCEQEEIFLTMVKNTEVQKDGERKEAKKYFSKWYKPKTRQEIEENFKRDFKMVKRDTPISLSSGETPNSNDGERGFEERFNEKYKKEEMSVSGISDDRKLRITEDGFGGREIVNMCWVFPKTGQKLTKEQLMIAESHEKGHILRPYTLEYVEEDENGNEVFKCFLSEKFSKAFDFGAARFTDEECEDQKKFSIDEREKAMTNDEIRAELLLYLDHPAELTERMSQIKNYFGMNGSEKFTKEHLDYARKHYVPDTNFDNWMTQFFQAITPEKEDAFIELINSAGI
jgi:hypothetical protein